jgi:hypothetical protein
MTYTLTNHPDSVSRDRDGAYIPFDPGNKDYQEYLKWLDEGNEPNPPPSEPQQPIAPSPSDKEIGEAVLRDHEQRISDLEQQMARLTRQKR